MATGVHSRFIAWAFCSVVIMDERLGSAVFRDEAKCMWTVEFALESVCIKCAR